MSGDAEIGASLGRLLNEVEQWGRAVEEAASAHDWPRAESTDTALKRSLNAIEELLAGIDPADGRLQRVGACLAAALARYERATALLCGARNEVAAELRKLRGARVGAAAYEEAADC
jgi:hypothetical protein